MKATVDALVQVALYSAAITAGILLFRFILKNRISSKLQYLMWWLLILRLLMPVTPDIGLHFNLQDMLLKQAHQAELPAPVLDVAPASVPNTQSSYESVAPAVQPDTDVAPSQHVNPAKSIDWYSIVFVVWLLGAIGFLGWLIFVKLRYYESLQHLMAGGPREVYELYDRCCKELGVKPLPLWIVNKSMSPGIAFFGEPVLLVPLSLCNDESRLRFALLHELTHKKRGDHYMTLLLNILRAVYWFDPVVHFAFSELRSDIESACDSDVLAYIGHEQKRGYLTVILDMFSYDTEPILGMSQIRSRRMAKRRMKGAFMKNRTSPAFRAITLCIALIMSLCCFTTACQSAPEKDTPGMAAEQTADPSPKPTLIPDPSAQEPEAAAATYAFDRTDPKQAVAEFLTRYLDDMAHGNDDFGFDSSNNTMYDGLLQLQGSFESHKNIALLRQWISFTQVLRETTVPTMDRGKFQNLEITEFGIVDQLSGGIMYEYLLKGYFKTTVMGTFIEAGLIKDGDKYVITYVDFPDSKEYQNFCADFIDYAERNDIKDYNKNAYIEYIRKQKQQAAERYPIAAPESDPSSGLTSSAVADIQSALKALGYLENPSGAYDSATRTAIEMFQEDNALPSDGIAGDETLALLLSDSAKNWTLADGIYTGDKRIWREPPKDGVDGWSSIAADKISAYSGSSVTSTGAECKLGTASVNPNAIPIGTELYIPGYGYAIAADVNAYKNKVNHLTKEPLNMIDLWFASKEDARKWENKHNFTILYRSADARPAREAPTADAIAATAKNQVGKEYVLNASGPDEFDCSGLVYYVFNECGIAVDRKDCAGYAQNADWSKIESLSDVKAGDILFFCGEDGKIRHAGIAVSSKNMIDASSSHRKVAERGFQTRYWKEHFAFARRVVE